MYPIINVRTVELIWPNYLVASQANGRGKYISFASKIMLISSSIYAIGRFGETVGFTRIEEKMIFKRDQLQGEIVSRKPFART